MALALCSPGRRVLLRQTRPAVSLVESLGLPRQALRGSPSSPPRSSPPTPPPPLTAPVSSHWWHHRPCRATNAPTLPLPSLLNPSHRWHNSSYATPRDLCLSSPQALPPPHSLQPPPRTAPVLAAASPHLTMLPPCAPPSSSLGDVGHSTDSCAI